MTFYEQLEKHLSVKQHVLVQDEDGNYCIFSHFTDSAGHWRMSRWHLDEKEAIDTIGSYVGWNRARINKAAEESKLRIIKAFDVPTGRFQVGDKVLVSEDARELCAQTDIIWVSTMEEMYGKVCEVKDANSSGSGYKVFTPDKSDWWIFPHSALSYPIETEEKEELLAIDPASTKGDYGIKVYGYYQKDGVVKITRIESDQEAIEKEEESFAIKLSYKGIEFDILNLYQDEEGIKITTKKDLKFVPFEKIILNNCVYIIKEVRHDPANFFNSDDTIVIEAYPIKELWRSEAYAIYDPEEKNQKLPSEVLHETVASDTNYTLTPAALLRHAVGKTLDRLAKKNNWKV